LVSIPICNKINFGIFSYNNICKTYNIKAWYIPYIMKIYNFRGVLISNQRGVLKTNKNTTKNNIKKTLQKKYKK